MEASIRAGPATAAATHSELLGPISGSCVHHYASPARRFKPASHHPGLVCTAADCCLGLDLSYLLVPQCAGRWAVAANHCDQLSA